jgi:hypothetical protein
MITSHRRFSNDALAGVILLSTSTLLIACPATAQTTTLYNASAGTTPGAQGSLILGNVFGATETFQAGPPASTKLNSTANEGIYAGYTNYNVALSSPINPAFPTLNAASGYSLNFTMQLVSETHTGNNNRAGFSVLLLGSDKKGIEIGFQSGGVFSQSTSFTQAETNFGAGVPSVLGALTNYDLRILGDTYTLSTGNTTLLTGLVRDYSGNTGIGTDVYRTANFLFLGDDTTSASANVNLAAVTISTNIAPEPASGVLALLGIGFPATVFLRRRKA